MLIPFVKEFLLSRGVRGEGNESRLCKHSGTPGPCMFCALTISCYVVAGIPPRTSCGRVRSLSETALQSNLVQNFEILQGPY